ncbi:hypothetical protein BS17DRAFT_771340 [Gyrodon lividus]|nr:hypothetical protein BS17DRAFT_771340 [Gyrodon lividus]
MAPVTKYLAFFSLALSAAALTSPHISRNVYNHAHRGLVHVALDVETPPAPLPVASSPKRKRSLNKRCLSRPANTTSSAVPTSVPTTTTPPVNVAPAPVLPPSSPSSVSPPPPPPPTSSPPPPPTTSQAPPSPPTTTSAPPPAQTSSSSSNSGEPSFMIGTQAGQGTYYATGLGACGITNNDGQPIAAVSHLLFDAYPGYDGVNPNDNPVCGKWVTATSGSSSVSVQITDRCTGCAITDLDFSPFGFDALADPSVGRIPITWVWS